VVCGLGFWDSKITEQKTRDAGKIILTYLFFRVLKGNFEEVVSRKTEEKW